MTEPMIVTGAGQPGASTQAPPRQTVEKCQHRDEHADENKTAAHREVAVRLVPPGDSGESGGVAARG